MSYADPGVLVALFIGLGTAIATAITAWKRSPSENLAILKARARTAEDELAARLDWEIGARKHMHDCRSALADNGIQIPALPEGFRLIPTRGSNGD